MEKKVEKHLKHFYDNRHLWTTNLRHSYHQSIFCRSSLEGLVNVTESILGMKVHFLSFILHLAIIAWIMKHLHIFKCYHLLFVGFHGQIGCEPLYCFENISRITEICLETSMSILHLLMNIALWECVPCSSCWKCNSEILMGQLLMNQIIKSCFCGFQILYYNLETLFSRAKTTRTKKRKANRLHRCALMTNLEMWPSVAVSVFLTGDCMHNWCLYLMSFHTWTGTAWPPLFSVLLFLTLYTWNNVNIDNNLQSNGSAWCTVDHVHHLSVRIDYTFSY